MIDAPPKKSPPDSRSRSWVGPLAALWSAAIAVIGAWWLVAPDTFHAHPTADDALDASLVAQLDPTLVSALMVALGAVGALLAVIGFDPRSASPYRWLLGPALLYVVVFGFLAPDMGLLVGIGYAIALLGIPAAAVGVFVLAARHGMFRWIALGVVAAAIAAVVAFDVDGDAVARTIGEIGGSLPDFLRGQAPALVAFAGGLLWSAVALRAAGVRLRGARPVRYAPPVHDWGWWVTVAAVVCPLLFAAQRLTWLTPWPVALSAHDLEAEPGLRMFGLFLGLAAVGGATLTAGLIARWGVIYPRWMPVLGGREVSPVWPAVSAAIVGLVVAIAGRSMGQAVLLADADDDMHPLLVSMAVMFVVWGPLLVAAAVAYYRRRTTRTS